MRLTVLLLVLAACGTPAPLPENPSARPVRIDPRVTSHGIAWSELGSGPPLVLLNGTGSPMAEWDPAFLSAVATGRRVIVFDYPGLGDSTATARTTFAGLAATTAQFMADIGVPRADVLGWSMGGFVVQELLRGHPSRVSRAVLVGTNAGGRYATLGPRWVQRADSDPGAGVRTYLRTNYPRTRCAQRRGRDFVTRLEAAVESGRYPQAKVPAATYDLMVDAEDPWLRSSRNGKALRQVDTAVLVMAGTGDVITPPANSRALSALLPQSDLLLVPGAGHSVLFQNPAESAAAISAFLDGQPAAGGAAWPCA